MAKASTLSYLARVVGVSIIGSLAACLLLAGYRWLHPPKVSYPMEDLLRWYAMLACVAFWIFAILVGILLYPAWDDAQSVGHAD
jgi:hypothetical protein